MDNRTTFLECAQKCRELLFATFGEEGREDDGDYKELMMLHMEKR